jgi:hypothetical protein
MLKRLIDAPDLEGADAELADLLRAAAPFETDPFRKRRVLVSMNRVRARRAARFWLRPAIVAALLVSGTATAAIGHRYHAPFAVFFGFGAKPVSPNPASAIPLKSRPVPVPEQASHVVPPAIDPASASAPALAPLPISHAPLSPPKPASRPHPDSSEDATHVVEAIQALRTERDPSRAQGLLRDYLNTHPNGVLSEDALALSIEAASAQHDPRAADYARRYLAQFPRGKYRILANRALAKER